MDLSARDLDSVYFTKADTSSRLCVVCLITEASCRGWSYNHLSLVAKLKLIGSGASPETSNEDEPWRSQLLCPSPYSTGTLYALLRVVAS